MSTPKKGMRVVWGKPSGMGEVAGLCLEKNLTRIYGKREMTVRSARKCSAGWLVVLERDGKVIRDKCWRSDELISEDQKGDPLEINWVYLRLAES